ncbi:hypothetical protein LTR66_015667, partial [Elasticomyces elasticus]
MHPLVILSLQASAALAAAIVKHGTAISTNSRDSTLALSLGSVGLTTTINSGVTYSMSGGSTHNFFGNLNNSGTLLVSQTDYLSLIPLAGGMTSDWSGSGAANGNLNNYAGASISINDYGAASGSTYAWNLNSMNNLGSLQFCGRGDTGGSTYQLYCNTDCYNYGTLDYEQYNNNLGATFTWRNFVIGTAASNNIYNQGAFRLVNTVYHSVQNVLGNGCWVIDQGAALYLEDGSGINQNPSAGSTFANQNIYFVPGQTGSNTQTLHMDIQVYSHNSNFGPQVYGFGKGMAIEFFETIKSQSYANSLLTVNFVSGNTVNIKIGSGYTASLSSIGNNPMTYNIIGYNAIRSSAAAPSQSVASTCQVSLAKCAPPSANLVASSSASVSSMTSISK